MTVILFLSCAAFYAGCGGHGETADPYTSDPGTEAQDFDARPEISPGKYAKYAVEDMALDLLATSHTIIELMAFNTIGFPSLSAKSTRTGTLNVREISVSKKNEAGDPALAVGTAVSMENTSRHCAIFTLLDIEYGSYVLNKYVTIEGSGQAKMMLTALGCKYYRNIHAEVVVTGSFRIITYDPNVSDQAFTELVFAADFDVDEGTDLKIKSVQVATDDGPLFCYDFDGSTECVDRDYRPVMEASTCSGSNLSYRECNPAEETFFTSSYLYYEPEPTPYEVALICTDAGMWSPPCALDGAFDICPQGTTCVASETVDWGPGLEAYGVCTCATP